MESEKVAEVREDDNEAEVAVFEGPEAVPLMVTGLGPGGASVHRLKKVSIEVSSSDTGCDC